MAKTQTQGATFYPLSEQIKDSALAHGFKWATWHYTEKKNGPQLSPFEWNILAQPAKLATIWSPAAN